jgi:Mg-chelatase subunit ChlD
MHKLLFYILFPFCLQAQLAISNQITDLGLIKDAYEITGDVVLKNIGAKNIYLLRADSEYGMKIFTSKKTITPNDTALLSISFYPEYKGKFKKKIKLITNNSSNPYLIELIGNVENITLHNKQACFYFGSKIKNSIKNNNSEIVFSDQKKERDYKIPVDTSINNEEKTKIKTINNDDGSILNSKAFKPNNIVFLIDVSNSMKDSLKFPLMKKSIYYLINQLRDIDKITFVTYSDTVKLLNEAVKGSEKLQLIDVIKNLKAGGKTKGNKAIVKCQTVAQNNFIKNGNNIIFLCTDGEFGFYKKDQEQFLNSQVNGKVILTTVAFGDDKKAMDNLKRISKIGEGSFIQIKNNSSYEEKLLNEIKQRSLIKN